MTAKPIHLVLLTAVALLLVAQSAAGSPRLVVDQPVFDFGPVAEGDQLAHDFILRNEGSTALRVLEVNPTCGCTVADYDRTVPPGGSGKIHAVLDSSDLRGPVAKSITVLTNDPDNPRLNLVIKANVRQRVSVEPGYARFVVVQGDAPAPSTQLVWAEGFERLSIEEVESPYPYLTVSYREAVGAERRRGVDGRQWQVELKLEPTAPVGGLAEHVRLRLNHPEQRWLRIPVAGFVRPILAVSPPSVDFGKRELSAPYHARAEVKNLSDEPIRVTEVEIDVKGARAKVNPLEEGKRYELQVTLVPGEMERGDFAGQVTIHTTSSRQPVVVVDVKGSVL